MMKSMMKNKKRQKKKGILILPCILLFLVLAAIGCMIIFGNEIGIRKLFKDWDKTWAEGNYEAYSDLYLTGFDSIPSEGYGDDYIRKTNAGIKVTHKVDRCEKLTYRKYKSYLPGFYNVPQSIERLKPDAAYAVTCTATVSDEVNHTEDVSTGDMLVIKYNGKWYLGYWLIE